MNKKKETKDTKENTMEQQSSENFLNNNKDIYQGFNPLDEPVTERSYTKSNINSNNLEVELEEPSFESPNFNDFDVQDEEPSSFNPSINDLDKKEKTIATEQMVDTVLDVYGKAHILASNFTKIKEQKISDAIQEGEINPNLRIPIDEDGNSLALLEYVQEYNDQLSDAIQLEEDFIEKVKPPMIRVFQKKGLAMTDEQYLGVTFGVDILQKTALIFQLVKQNNKLIEMWKNQSDSYKQSGEKTKKSPNQSSKPTENYESDEQPIERTESKTIFEEPEEFTAESMVNDMMGANQNSNFEDIPQSDDMPQFGNPEILSKLDAMAKKNEDKYIVVSDKKQKTKKRGRPKKK